MRKPATKGCRTSEVIFDTEPEVVRFEDMSRLPEHESAIQQRITVQPDGTNVGEDEMLCASQVQDTVSVHDYPHSEKCVSVEVERTPGSATSCIDMSVNQSSVPSRLSDENLLQKLTGMLQRQHKGIIIALSNICNFIQDFQAQRTTSQDCRQSSASEARPVVNCTEPERELRFNSSTDRSIHNISDVDTFQRGAHCGISTNGNSDVNNHHSMYDGDCRSYSETQYRHSRRDRGVDSHHGGSGNGDYRQDDYLRPRSFANTRSSQGQMNAVKIPPFTGGEDWKIWLCRFETLARRYGWDDEVCLDQLLPRIQGPAADFVFSKLPQSTLSDYDELVRDISTRYRIIEPARTYAGKFNRRVQSINETAEEYAADLKRLYDKAYPNRERNTRREDLLRRFIDGLHDDEARFTVDFHKEPADIDEAVYFVVNFIQTRRGREYGRYNPKGERKVIRLARDEPFEHSEETDGEEDSERTPGVPARRQVHRGTGKPRQDGLVSNPVESPELDVFQREIRDQAKVIQDIQGKLDELTRALGTWSQFEKMSKLTCFNCSEKGHFARDCPGRTQFKTEGQQRWQRGPQFRRLNRDRRRYHRQKRRQSSFELRTGVQEKDRIHSSSNIVQSNIQRKAGLSDGVYVEGKLEGVPILFTVDTGASQTVVSNRLYDRLGTSRRPPLHGSNILTGTGGAPLREKGKGKFNIQLGPLELNHEIVIADIEDDCLIGIDLLQNNTVGPADILLSKGMIRLRGHDIPCKHVGIAKETRKVAADDNLGMPAQVKTINDVFIDRNDGGDSISGPSYLIEPKERGQENYPQQDAVFELAERIKGQVTEIMSEREYEETGNDKMRRIQAVKNEQKGGVVSNGYVSVGFSRRRNVSENLNQPRGRVRQGRKPGDQAGLADPQLKRQDIFPRAKLDRGLTHLTEPAINTGQAVPKRLNSRCMPPAVAGDEQECRKMVWTGANEKSADSQCRDINTIKPHKNRPRWKYMKRLKNKSNSRMEGIYVKKL